MPRRNHETNSYQDFVGHLTFKSRSNKESEKPSPETDAELLKLFKELVPQDKFGEVAVTTALPEFRAKYNAAIQAGDLEAFLSEFLGQDEPLSSIYVARSNPDSLTSPADLRIVNNHQPERLRDLESKLEIMLKAIDESSVSEAVKGLYRQKVAATRQFIATALELGQPGFTREQQSSASWSRLLDMEKTAQTGEVTMPYEDAALTILENNTEAQAVYPNVLEPLDTIWKLSEKEKAAFQYETLNENTLTLTPEQGKKLFEIILERVDLADWVVEWSSSSAIDVNAPAKKISFPQTRELSGDDIAYVIAHELIHVLRGVNGAKQSASILESGMDDYLATEEGLATLSEMIVGQPFGHRRQALFAARYWAVAQALKVEFDPTTQEKRAKYTMQEIFDKLVEFNISVKDATEIVWRISRGTSLKRKVVDVEIERETVAVAETFTKDSVYFVGQMMMFNVFKEIMPLLEGENVKGVIKDAGSFSDRVLARIGRAIVKEQVSEQDDTTVQDRAEVYAFLVKLGREALLGILQYFIPGKMTLEAAYDPEWLSVLQRDSLTQYRKIFTAKE